MKNSRLLFDRELNIEKISKENRSLADKLAAFTKKLLDGVKKFFTAKEVREKYPAVTLTSKQFKDFATRIDENIYAMQSNKVIKSSKGYKILSVMPRSPYESKKLVILLRQRIRIVQWITL